MRPGDILGVHAPPGEASTLALAIAESGKPGSPLGLVHIALYLGGGHVLEAQEGAGVQEVSLDTWMEGREFTVFRMRGLGDEDVKAICDLSRSILGRPYNSYFQQDHEGFYCSELVQFVYNSALDREVFPFSPMYFGDEKTVAFWEERYGSAGLPVPHGLPGTHPNMVLQNPDLVRVFECRSVT